MRRIVGGQWIHQPKSWLRLASSTAAAGSHGNPMPPPQRSLAGRPFHWTDAAKQTAKVDLTPPLENISRTTEYRKRVAGWIPIVKTLGDQRLRVAIVGRMNSGKSSLFNLLASQTDIPHDKLVRDYEGVTRDSVEALGHIGAMPVTIVDTPGMVKGQVIEESMRSIETADAVIFVASADREVHPDENYLVRFLAARRLPTFLLVNKIDLVAAEDEDRVLGHFSDSLGLGNAIPFSCRQRDGEEMLAAAVKPFWHLQQMHQTQADWELEDAAVGGDEFAMEEIRDRNVTDRYVRVAIVGRSNCGKSSLMNRLVGYERSRSADEVNTTRDPIEIPCIFKGKRLMLVDTAGMARKRYLRERDFLSSCHRLTSKAIEFAHVVVVVFDATEGHPNNHDMAIIHQATEEGRPVVLAANKWDAVIDPSATAEAIDFKLKRMVREAKYCQAVVTSAHSGLNLSLLLEHALKVYDTWNKRIPASELTRFWRRLEKSVAIPHHVSRVARISQVNTRPPTFRLQLQTKDDSQLLPPLYVNMLKNALIEEFGFHGTPIRIVQDVKDSLRDYL